MATRCDDRPTMVGCCGPSSRERRERELRPSFYASRLGSSAPAAPQESRVDDLQMREEVECWKTMPIRCRSRALGALAGDLLAREEDPTAVDRLDRLMQRRSVIFPLPWPDTTGLARRDLEVST